MLTIVIPTYKEARNVDILLPKIYQTLQMDFKNLRIILIDDDSQDGLEAVVERHNKNCGGVIKLKIRKGKKGIATAWKEGIKESTTEYIGIMDADLAHDPKDLLRLMNEVSSADMVIGSRYLPHQRVEMEGKSFLATYLSKTGQRLCRMILQIPVYDMSHSFRVFHRSVFDKVGDFLNCSGNAMMIEFTYHTTRAGFRIKEIPISYGKRLYGQTKLDIFSEGMKFFKILFELKIKPKKISYD